MKESIIFYNGSFLPAQTPVMSCLDGGVLYGRGLFETLRVKEGLALELEGHLKRMAASAAKLEMPLAYEIAQMGEMVAETVRRNGIELGVVRITATAGTENGSPSLFVITRPFPYTEDDYIRGFTALVASCRRNPSSPLVRHKTINYWENILARREALRKGFDEAVFLNTRGLLAEGSVSNIFFVKGSTVMTPPLEAGLLAGLARERVLSLCPGLGIKVLEKNIRPQEINSFQGCFITNSLLGVMPVLSISDGQKNLWKFAERELTEAIQKEY